MLNTKESECLVLLREKIKDDDTLLQFKEFFNDEFLLHFIRGRKFRVEYAMQTLQQYFYVRSVKYRDFFLEIMPSKLKLKDVFGKPLKHLGPEGQTIIYARREWWPTLKKVYKEGITADDGLQKFIVGGEELWKRSGVDVNGFEIVLDLSHVSFSDILWILHVSYAIKLLNLFHKAFPLRAKKIHLINPPMYVNLVVNLIRPIDPAGYLKRIYSHHGNLESLHKHFSPEILPQCLNGNLSEADAFDDDFDSRSTRNDAPFIKLHQHLKRLS